VISKFPIDLAVVLGYVAVVLTVNFADMATPIRAVLTTPLIAFVPGYVLVSSVYPRHSEGESSSYRLQSSRHPGSSGGLNVVARLALSFGMSVALVPLVGGILWAGFEELSRLNVLVALVFVTLVLVPVSAVRRLRVLANEQGAFRPRESLRALNDWLLGPTTANTGTNVLLVVAVLTAAVTFTYALAAPVDGESYTTATLLTEQDDKYVASGYPSTFTTGESKALVLELRNHERHRTTYSVVVAVERVEPSETGNSILEQTVLNHETLSLQPGERVRHESAVAPETVGEELRLSYYVYKGQTPDTADSSSAYRDLHLWITVEDGS
jgi:uncharacterized membrane protein